MPELIGRDELFATAIVRDSGELPEITQAKEELDYSQPGTWSAFVENNPWAIDDELNLERNARLKAERVRGRQHAITLSQGVGPDEILPVKKAPKPALPKTMADYDFSADFVRYLHATSDIDRNNAAENMHELLSLYARDIVFGYADRYALQDFRWRVRIFLGHVAAKKPTDNTLVPKITDILEAPDLQATYLDRMIGEDGENWETRWIPCGESERIWLADQRKRLRSYPVAVRIIYLLAANEVDLLATPGRQYSS